MNLLNVQNNKGGEKNPNPFSQIQKGKKDK